MAPTNQRGVIKLWPSSDWTGITAQIGPGVICGDWDQSSLFGVLLVIEVQQRVHVKECSVLEFPI
jgi:hypothetical protein